MIIKYRRSTRHVGLRGTIAAQLLLSTQDSREGDTTRTWQTETDAVAHTASGTL
jgi:hypothetical protein